MAGECRKGKVSKFVMGKEGRKKGRRQMLKLEKMT